MEDRLSVMEKKRLPWVSKEIRGRRILVPDRTEELLPAAGYTRDRIVKVLENTVIRKWYIASDVIAPGVMIREIPGFRSINWSTPHTTSLAYKPYFCTHNKNLQTYLTTLYPKTIDTTIIPDLLSNREYSNFTDRIFLWHDLLERLLDRSTLDIVFEVRLTAGQLIDLCFRDDIPESTKVVVLVYLVRPLKWEQLAKGVVDRTG
jgi:hypothetical protein